MNAEDMMTDRSKASGVAAQAILERSQQRIKDIAEIMGGSSQFTTSMHMFGAKNGEEFIDEDI